MLRPGHLSLHICHGWIPMWHWEPIYPNWFTDCEVLCADPVVDLHCVRLFTCIRMCSVYCFLGIPLGLIPGTSECMRMLPRSVRGIYRVQVDCVTELGIYYPPLGLVVSRRYPEGQLLSAFSKLLASYKVRFYFIVASISGVCVLRSTASGSVSWVGYSGLAYCVMRKNRGTREPTRFHLVTVEEDTHNSKKRRPLPAILGW